MNERQVRVTQVQDHRVRDSQVRDRRRAQGGFTLIEIMVVIVILGLLATLVARNVISASDEARVTKAQTDVRIIADAVREFRAKNSKLPTLEDLTVVDDKGHSYLDSLPRDPWDHDYILQQTDRGGFEVLSMGPDGSQGTEDDISSVMKAKDR